MTPAVSVVVPTFRRNGALARLLAALAAQRTDGLDWEVLVVDNDPPGAEATVAAASGVPAAYLAEPVLGTVHARNTGLAAARGEVVAFLDDDVVPDPGWLVALTGPVLAGACDVAGGRVLLDPTRPRPFWFNEDALGGYLARFDLGPEPTDIATGGWVITANAAFRAPLLRAAGGFDPAFGPRGRVPLANEELDLCRRLVGLGARIRYVPATVVHDLPEERLRLRYLLRRTFNQGRSDWLLDREANLARPLRGAGLAAHQLRRALTERVRTGPWKPTVLAIAACDLARAAGWVCEAVSARGPRPRGSRRAPPRTPAS